MFVIANRMSYLDLFSEKAGLYASARPVYPDALFRFVASIAEQHDRVWDCGAGNGQASIGLAQHFVVVEATDASEQQIVNHIPHGRVRYSVQPAENTDFPTAHFDAVCVAQALHWFDFDRFYPEVQRVLKPNGIFVAWGYDWFKVSPDFDAQFKESILDVINPFWAAQNRLLWNGYRDVPFPFTRIETPEIAMEVPWTFPQLLAYVHTWSATRRCMAGKGNQFFEDAERKLAPHWGTANVPRNVSMRLHLLAGRHQRGKTASLS
jgi:SAM-dependent methyltransferase